MREILFRAERTDGGEWVYGYPVGWQNEEGDISIVDSRFGACIDESGNLMMLEAPFVAKVDPATIGQYTGLTDKNGKKIFEGDIVECVSWNEFFSDGFGKPIEALRRKMEVAFHNGAFRMKESYPYGIEPTYWDLIFNGDIEVIGNIHDKEATE